MALLEKSLDYTGSNSSFIQLFENQAARYKDKTFICYQTSNNPIKFSDITYGQFNCAANYLAHTWAPRLSEMKCVAFLGDEPVYSLLAMVAILKLRRVYFAISSCVPEALVTEMLTKASTDYLITTKQYQHVARSISNIQSHVWDPISPKALMTLGAGYDNNMEYSVKLPTESLDDVVIKLHSSGSTGVPKPMSMTNRWMIMLIQTLAMESKSKWKGLGLDADSVILPTAPLFHSTGIVAYFWSALYGCHTIALRSLPPTSQELLSTLEMYRPDVVFTAPVILNDLAEELQDRDISKATIHALNQVRLCLFGGDQLITRAGDFLLSQGLNIRSIYGLTELGPLCVADVTKSNKRWDTFGLFDSIASYCHWEPFDGDIYHLLVRSNCPWLSPTAPINDNGYYETTDLFRKDLANPDYWIHVSRTSDALVMDNGKKVYPTSMEREIRNARIVKQCSVIGENRARTAALIELNMHYAAKCSDERIISEVHAAIQAANSMIPKHSIINVPDMIYVLPPNKKLKLISKGAASRGEAIQDFKEEIEKMYT